MSHSLRGIFAPQEWATSRWRAIGTALALCWLVATVACSDSTGPDPIGGIYLLTAVDGQTPPQTTQFQGSTWTVLNGQFRVNEDSTSWGLSLSLTAPGQGLRGVIAGGTYNRSANTLTLQGATLPGGTATIAGKTLTVRPAVVTSELRFGLCPSCR